MFGCMQFTYVIHTVDDRNRYLVLNSYGPLCEIAIVKEIVKSNSSSSK